MGIFVFCSQKSTGARGLAESLGGVRLRNFDGLDFWVRGKKVSPKTGDLIVCWGGSLPEFEDVKVLNGKTPGNKFKSALLLQGGGVPTITVATHKAGEEYIPRLNNHVGGDDLLKPPAKPDFWVRKEGIVKEYRIHSFCDKTIRSGVKIPRDGYSLPTSDLATVGGSSGKIAHPWIRSFDAGWRIRYDEFKSTSAMRGISKKAVKVLGLDFAAVDLGERADGSIIVLEVNRAPGIEGGSVEAYKNAIARWIEEGGLRGEAKGEIEAPTPSVEAQPAPLTPPVSTMIPSITGLTYEQAVARATAAVAPVITAPRSYAEEVERAASILGAPSVTHWAHTEPSSARNQTAPNDNRVISNYYRMLEEEARMTRRRREAGRLNARVLGRNTPRRPNTD